MGVDCKTNGCLGEPTYPRIMKSRASGVIVLMYRYGCGTVLCGKSNFGGTVGSHDNDWDMSSFYDYNQSVTLSNN